MADVVLTDEAAEQLEKVPIKIHARFVKILERLQDWPDVSGAKALKGDLAGWFRMRTGDYRLRFRVENDKIVVAKIGHRRDFYGE